MPQRFKGRINIGILGLAGGVVTGSAGAATLNAPSGKVTTESLTTAALTAFTLTLTNSYIAAGDIVLVSFTTTGTGTPVLLKVTPAAGSCVIVIYNTHATVAFSAAFVVSFAVIKQ